MIIHVSCPLLISEKYQTIFFLVTKAQNQAHVNFLSPFFFSFDPNPNKNFNGPKFQNFKSLSQFVFFSFLNLILKMGQNPSF
jgi:hypothetical protein